MNEILQFQETVWEYYNHHGRHDLPWRQPNIQGVFDPYHILVSELMLQQTQVGRVIPKYNAFLEQFPSITALAEAELGDVLRAWQGLGYNRRAKFLWQSANMVKNEHKGIFPRTEQDLVSLPGVGVNTAGAIQAYAYDVPVVFVETNIRTVIIHHFFADQQEISDGMIRQKVHETLPEHESPRQWYWALMDYGTYLKQTRGNLNKLSKEYMKQSKFQGSRRQVRGQILRMLSNGPIAQTDIFKHIQDERAGEVLGALLHEGLIRFDGTLYSL